MFYILIYMLIVPKVYQRVVVYMTICGDVIYLPSIVMGELTYGFIKSSRQEFNERKLQEIIKKLQIEIIDVNQNVSQKYALIYLSLVIKGTKIPINDVWIAACCMEVGGTLLTRDRHFRYVEQKEAIILDN